SGLLFEKIGGESIKPVQPKNAWKTAEGNFASGYRRDRDEKQYRRALYIYWKRGSPYPSMLNFDAGKRATSPLPPVPTPTPCDPPSGPCSAQRPRPRRVRPDARSAHAQGQGGARPPAPLE